MLGPSALRDTLFGTRSYTQGAEYHLPRKIPLRVEPKTYFGGFRQKVSLQAATCDADNSYMRAASNTQLPSAAHLHAFAPGLCSQ